MADRRARSYKEIENIVKVTIDNSDTVDEATNKLFMLCIT